ncbi:hypothetical protein [Novipirellula artificiosorum]|uniref:Methyltransferase domain-containing protein n=1 Tax=Novipirellula artificiosorum TaxID=2528016 RepID=A0A5C6E5F6_9BACT|nr:hypothetical protein [Novipirellula artificiosorum]TWU42831.1 hypothetical protein Poly41_11320 [Novipirellula artificiosorum]
MSLLKLWNSLCGRSSEAKKQPLDGGPDEKSQSAASTAQGTPERAASEKLDPKPSRSRFGLNIGSGRNSDSGLCKLLKPLEINTLLEVGVGDGARAVAIVSSLQRSRPDAKLRYAAIDQFELGEGAVTLMQFHKRVRAEGISPQIFPDAVDQGLMRLSHTIGRVDVVVMGLSAEKWQTPPTLGMLRRVCHEKTSIFYSDDGTWKSYQLVSDRVRKAA